MQLDSIVPSNVFTNSYIDLVVFFLSNFIEKDRSPIRKSDDLIQVGREKRGRMPTTTCLKVVTLITIKM
jgi:hypothetical protein